MDNIILKIPLNSTELVVKLPERTFLQLKKVVENVFKIKFSDGEKTCHCEVCSGDNEPDYFFYGEEGEEIVIKVVPLWKVKVMNFKLKKDPMKFIGFLIAYFQAIILSSSYIVLLFSSALIPARCSFWLLFPFTKI